jgi:MFS transporter, putative metabolite:H+ symporter
MRSIGRFGFLRRTRCAIALAGKPKRATLISNSSGNPGDVGREDAMLDLLERQERLTVNQWKVVTVAILGGALGSLAFLLPSFAVGVASALRHLTYARSPLIHLSTGVGTILGGIFWGWMADRIGRRKAFIATVLNVSLASGIMAATPDQGALMFLTVCCC